MSTDKKRSALEEIGGVPKKPMTQLSPNSRTTRTQIAYHSSIEDQENILDVCVAKMIKEAPLLEHIAEQQIAANKPGFEMVAEIKELRTEVANLRSENQERFANLESSNHKLEAFRQKHLDLRQRAIATWVRDALNKDTQGRKDEVRRLNQTVIHAGDVRSDVQLVTERYKSTSTERKHFSTLYGLSAENFLDVDQQKCPESLKALDRAASILLKHNRTSFPSDTTLKQRGDIVALLLKEKYEEAEKTSSTFLCDE